ncbi:MAG: hypothetical protein IPM29_21405 [Planctomycetes bacterium]|nr:hypothetical protein [Planctomycetota bacterium]
MMANVDLSPRPVARARLAIAGRSMAVCVLLAVSLDAQRTWVVDDLARPGYDFMTLTAAHDAASNGDSVLVRYGSGVGYALPRQFTKGLRVLGEGPSRSVLLYQDGSISCPALEVALFDNLELRAAGFSRWLPGAGDSDGTVIYSRCYFPPLNSHPSSVYHSHRVIYVDCDIDSVTPAVSIYRSDVLLLGCRTVAHFSRYNSLGEGGVYVKEGGRVTIVGGSVTGGDGYQDCIGYIRLPGPAVTAFSDRAFIYGPVVLAGGVLRGPCGNGYREIEFWSNCGPENVGALAPLAIPNRSWSCPHYISREMPAIVAGPAARGQHQTLQVWGPSHSNVTVFASLLHRRPDRAVDRRRVAEPVLDSGGGQRRGERRPQADADHDDPVLAAARRGARLPGGVAVTAERLRAQRAGHGRRSLTSAARAGIGPRPSDPRGSGGSDGAARKELCIAGSRGIWKWRQS